MFNQYPLWKYLLVFFVLALGTIYFLPNLYPEDPAVQISGASSARVLTEQDIATAKQALQQVGIDFKAVEFKVDSALIRLHDLEVQLKAQDAVKQALGDDYLVALNLAPTTPAWLLAIGARPMNLGLDLRGGVHFLIEVDMKEALAKRLDAYLDEIKVKLREKKIRYRAASLEQNGLQLKFKEAVARDEAYELINAEFADFVLQKEEAADEYFIQLSLREIKIKEIQDYAVGQNLTTLRNRVNELGVAEPIVQRQGPNRIVVELPGVQDTAAAKRILGATANLEFRLEADSSTPSYARETFPFRDGTDRTAVLEKRPILTGDRVVGAMAEFDQNSQPQVLITLDGVGGKAMSRSTRNNVGRNMAVLFIEQKSQTVKTPDGKTSVSRKQEKSIISLATIRDHLGARFVITGLDSPAESSELALLLRAGSLAAPVYIVEERTVGPNLGQENIKSGIRSGIIGILLVMLCMVIVYKAFGLLANLALTCNLILLIACLSIIGATLTVPGMAAIILTLGMAVDINVLVFSRIREELRRGLTPLAAITAGYDRAFLTVFDSNVTHLIVAVILYAIASGPVKGFAVVLSIGILTSMFTGILVTRAVGNLVYGRKPIKKLWI